MTVSTRLAIGVLNGTGGGIGGSSMHNEVKMVAVNDPALINISDQDIAFWSEFGNTANAGVFLGVEPSGKEVNVGNLQFYEGILKIINAAKRRSRENDAQFDAEHQRVNQGIRKTLLTNDYINRERQFYLKYALILEKIAKDKKAALARRGRWWGFISGLLVTASIVAGIFTAGLSLLLTIPAAAIGGAVWLGNAQESEKVAKDIEDIEERIAAIKAVLGAGSEAERKERAYMQQPALAAAPLKEKPATFFGKLWEGIKKGWQWFKENLSWMAPPLVMLVSFAALFFFPIPIPWPAGWPSWAPDLTMGVVAGFCGATVGYCHYTSEGIGEELGRIAGRLGDIGREAIRPDMPSLEQVLGIQDSTTYSDQFKEALVNCISDNGEIDLRQLPNDAQEANQAKIKGIIARILNLTPDQQQTWNNAKLSIINSTNIRAILPNLNAEQKADLARLPTYLNAYNEGYAWSKNFKRTWMENAALGAMAIVSGVLAGASMVAFVGVLWPGIVVGAVITLLTYLGSSKETDDNISIPNQQLQHRLSGKPGEQENTPGCCSCTRGFWARLLSAKMVGVMIGIIILLANPLGMMAIGATIALAVLTFAFYLLANHILNSQNEARKQAVANLGKAQEVAVEMTEAEDVGLKRQAAERKEASMKENEDAALLQHAVDSQPVRRRLLDPERFKRFSSEQQPVQAVQPVSAAEAANRRLVEGSADAKVGVNQFGDPVAEGSGQQSQPRHRASVAV